MSRMVCAGGVSTNTSTPTFIGWHWIIYQYPVILLFYLQWISYWYIYNITATSIDVEQTFSQGRLLLSHVCSRLSVQSTWALLCIGVWSLMGYVKDKDVKVAAVLPEVNGEEEELAADWDSLWVYITFFIMISSYSTTTSSTSHVSHSKYFALSP